MGLYFFLLQVCYLQQPEPPWQELGMQPKYLTRWQLHQGTHALGSQDLSSREEPHPIKLVRLDKQSRLPCAKKVAFNQDLQLIGQALQDTQSYRGLVLLGINKDIHRTLLHWMPIHSPAATQVYTSRITYRQLPDDWQNVASHLWHTLADKLPTKSILYLYMTDVTSCTTNQIKWLDQLARYVSHDRRTIKLIVGIPDSSLPAYKLFRRLEIQAVDVRHPVLTKEGIRLQLSLWQKENPWLSRLEDAADLLYPVASTLRRCVFEQAATWYLRAQTQGQQRSSTHCLQLAVKNASACFELDSEDDISVDFRSDHETHEEQDTTFDILTARYVFPEHELATENMVHIPPAMLTFAQKIHHSQQLSHVLPSQRHRLLLSGPPGVGKTCLARALAASLQLPFFAPNPASLVNSYIGVSANNIRAMFQALRCQAALEQQPMVLFLDELESLLGSRAEGGSGGEKEYSRMVTSFLAELEGIHTAQQDPIILIGATNFPHLLDPAIVSRFTDQVQIPLPDEKGRLAILTSHLKQRHHQLSTEQLRQCAQRMQGMSGRDIVQMLDKAALVALEQHIVQNAPSSSNRCQFEAVLQQSIDQTSLCLQLPHLEQAIKQQLKQCQEQDAAPPPGMYN